MRIVDREPLIVDKIPRIDDKNALIDDTKPLVASLDTNFVEPLAYKTPYMGQSTVTAGIKCVIPVYLSRFSNNNAVD